MVNNTLSTIGIVYIATDTPLYTQCTEIFPTSVLITVQLCNSRLDPFVINCLYILECSKSISLSTEIRAPPFAPDMQVIDARDHKFLIIMRVIWESGIEMKWSTVQAHQSRDCMSSTCHVILINGTLAHAHVQYIVITIP